MTLWWSPPDLASPNSSPERVFAASDAPPLHPCGRARLAAPSEFSESRIAEPVCDAQEAVAGPGICADGVCTNWLEPRTPGAAGSPRSAHQPHSRCRRTCGSANAQGCQRWERSLLTSDVWPDADGSLQVGVPRIGLGSHSSQPLSIAPAPISVRPVPSGAPRPSPCAPKQFPPAPRAVSPTRPDLARRVGVRAHPVSAIPSARWTCSAKTLASHSSCVLTASGKLSSLTAAARSSAC